MHELSVAQGILDRAMAAADENDAADIEVLTIELGSATHVNAGQLRRCLETIAEGTPAADARVAIERVEPRAVCDCGWQGDPPAFEGTAATVPAARCPACGSGTEFTRGKECRLASIEVPDRPESTDGRTDS